VSRPSPSRITRDTLSIVAEVSIRDLRNRGGDIVERAERGERLTITRAGTPVAELSALPGTPVALEVLIERRRNLPAVDPARFRRDLDALVDPEI
jgi:antitoxin (DNA-binding transcriptional repressor) of toxin-antitoxin stability system